LEVASSYLYSAASCWHFRCPSWLWPALVQSHEIHTNINLAMTFPEHTVQASYCNINNHTDTCPRVLTRGWNNFIHLILHTYMRPRLRVQYMVKVYGWEIHFIIFH
jgi:hypothetical protein